LHALDRQLGSFDGVHQFGVQRIADPLELHLGQLQLQLQQLDVVLRGLLRAHGLGMARLRDLIVDRGALKGQRFRAGLDAGLRSTPVISGLGRLDGGFRLVQVRLSDGQVGAVRRRLRPRQLYLLHLDIDFGPPDGVFPRRYRLIEAVLRGR